MDNVDEERSGLDALVRLLPLPSAHHVVKEVGELIHSGLVARELVRRQMSESPFYVLPLLTSVRDRAFGGETVWESLCLVALAAVAGLPDEEDLRCAAEDYLGPLNVRVSIRTRTQRAALRQGCDTERQVGSWYRRKRPKLVEAIAQQMIDVEAEHRRSALTLTPESVNRADSNVDIWDARVVEFKALAEQLDCFLGDIARWDGHKLGHAVIPGARIEHLYVSSLYRVAYFEYRHLAAERDRRQLWLEDPELQDILEESVWQFRLAPHFPEHVLAWLAMQVMAMPLPNVYAFGKILRDTPEGVEALARWKTRFLRCKCELPEILPGCALHTMKQHADHVVGAELAERLRLAGAQATRITDRTPAQQRELTVRAVHEQDAEIDTA